MPLSTEHAPHGRAQLRNVRWVGVLCTAEARGQRCGFVAQIEVIPRLPCDLHECSQY